MVLLIKRLLFLWVGEMLDVGSGSLKMQRLQMSNKIIKRARQEANVNHVMDECSVLLFISPRYDNLNGITNTL